MRPLFSPIHIVCEGDSEENYINALMQARERLGLRRYLLSHNACGGQCAAIVKKFKRLQNVNRNFEGRIWVDDDLYVRNENLADRQCAKSFENQTPAIRDKFLFCVHNFEDFLALHLEDDVLFGWIDICRANGHLESPMHSDEYMPLAQRYLFSKYRKGDLPFELNETAFRNLFRHNADLSVPLRSSFAAFLRREIFPAEF